MGRYRKAVRDVGKSIVQSYVGNMAYAEVASSGNSVQVTITDMMYGY